MFGKAEHTPYSEQTEQGRAEQSILRFRAELEEAKQRV